MFNLAHTTSSISFTLDFKLEHLFFATEDEFVYTLDYSPAYLYVTLNEIYGALLNRPERIAAQLVSEPGDPEDLQPDLVVSFWASGLWEDQNLIILKFYEPEVCLAGLWFEGERLHEADDLERVASAEFARLGGELAKLSPAPGPHSKVEEADGLSRRWGAHGIVPTDLTLPELLHLRNDLTLAAIHSHRAPTSPRQAVEILRLGGANRLIGMRESDWLDAKRPPYELRGDGKDEWKLELALDASSFANSDRGGLIIVGAATKNIGGSDVLVKLHPIPPNPGRAQRYHDVLSSKVAPLIDGLQIESHEHEGGELLTIFVPPQREDLKPFVTDGGISRLGHAGRLFSVVRRRGEGTSVASVNEIQAQLAAGKAFLRGQRPEPQNHS